MVGWSVGELVNLLSRTVRARVRVVVGVLLLLLGCWDALRGECECDGGGGHEVSVGAACNRLAAGSVEVRGHRTRDGCELLFSPCLFLFLVFSPRKRKHTFETQHVIDFLLLQYTNPPPRFKTTWLVQWPLRWQHSAFWYVSLPSRSLM